MYRIESFLSSRLFLVPQLIGEKIYFLSNLSGHISLYAMNYGGSVPEPLLPPNIALHNPHMLNGYSFYVFPELDRIIVMIDQDGDENYQPMVIPMDGGFPEPMFNNHFANYRVHLSSCDIDKNLVYFFAESREKPMNETFQGNLSENTLTKLAESEWGAFPTAHSEDHSNVLLTEGYTVGDSVLYQLKSGKKELLFGKPIQDRKDGEVISPNGLGSVVFTPSETAFLAVSAVFDDTYSLGLLDPKTPGELEPVKIEGIVHNGIGELEGLTHIKDTHYLVQYNIDGCTWLYEGIYDEAKKILDLKYSLVGADDLANGVLEHVYYDRKDDRFIISFSTATTPTQIYSLEGKLRELIVMHTNEMLLGIKETLLSSGEDASFTSFDGTRISARLYRPSKELGFKGPRPVVYYVHGGPQGQERPDFAWFSMPLIEFLTLKGFAVFVPNVRGSTGYGLDYTKQVDQDWGGQDRLDHVHAMTKILPKDKDLDVKRSAVVGRSYGGYMTLMLSGRHPELWSAACDMFGPYDLVTFSERIPETWKPYFKMALGDPETEKGRNFLMDRSPRTYLENLSCPMLVIQGRNDPRVVARESEDLVEGLKEQGKDIQLLIFEDEGHDVLKYENRVTCYNAITDFFSKYLKPW
ncbi:MAG TPA: prolyl oligopeptidase family serine peptidase [Anaerolineales bacterium]|nr:prolyl oligopeptidase family serine peptidase [Anaerolineales bacterium]